MDDATKNWPSYTPKELLTVQEIVQHEIIYETIKEGGNHRLNLAVARCESGFRPSAKNPNSSASCVYQFIKSTWASTESGKAGVDVFNMNACVKEGVKLLSNGGESHWYASINCWGHKV